MTGNPHFKSSKTFLQLFEKYQTIDDVWEGTDAMRNNGTKYLPREPKETLTNYNMRLERATFEPIFKRAIMQSVGKAFQKRVQVENYPTLLEPLLYNVDQTGTSLEAFAKELLTDATKYGVTYLMVDMPISDPNRTLADEISQGLYPYFVNIKPTQVLDLKVDYLDGGAQLTYFRMMEEVIDYDGLEQISIDQVKEFTYDEDDNIIFNIYRKDDKDKEYLYDSNVITGATSLPIVPVYGNKTSPYIGEPPLMDLAYMNILHYQKNTDIDVALHYGAMPMLVLKGHEQHVDPNTGNKDEITISPNSGINVSESGDAQWLELNGSGISTYMDNVKELEASMSMLGLELTSKKALYETATGRMLDEHTSNSILKSICIDLEGSLEKAFMYAGEYLNLNLNDVQVVIDTSLTVNSDIGFERIITMVKDGIITAQEGLQEIKERMLLVTNPEGVQPNNNTDNNNSNNNGNDE